jgi:hypothetical protein
VKLSAALLGAIISMLVGFYFGRTMPYWRPAPPIEPLGDAVTLEYSSPAGTYYFKGHQVKAEE